MSCPNKVFRHNLHSSLEQYNKLNINFLWLKENCWFISNDRHQFYKEVLYIFRVEHRISSHMSIQKRRYKKLVDIFATKQISRKNGNK